METVTKQLAGVMLILGNEKKVAEKLRAWVVKMCCRTYAR